MIFSIFYLIWSGNTFGANSNIKRKVSLSEANWAALHLLLGLLTNLPLYYYYFFLIVHLFIRCVTFYLFYFIKFFLNTYADFFQLSM